MFFQFLAGTLVLLVFFGFVTFVCTIIAMIVFEEVEPDGYSGNPAH